MVELGQHFRTESTCPVQFWSVRHLSFHLKPVCGYSLLACDGLQIHSSRVKVFGSLHMGASTQVPPVLPLTPLLPQVVDGDGVIGVSRYYALQDLQLVGFLDGFDARLCLFFADLQ